MKPNSVDPFADRIKVVADTPKATADAPRTAAGRITAVVDRLNASVPGPQSHPESGELLSIAIEAEAAAEATGLLRALVEAGQKVQRHPLDQAVPFDRLTDLWDAVHAARAYLDKRAGG